MVSDGYKLDSSAVEAPFYLAVKNEIEPSVAGRIGTPDESGAFAALLMGPDGGFITGSHFLMDGGVTFAYLGGELATK